MGDKKKHKDKERKKSKKKQKQRKNKEKKKSRDSSSDSDSSSSSSRSREKKKSKSKKKQKQQIKLPKTTPAVDYFTALPTTYNFHGINTFGSRNMPPPVAQPPPSTTPVPKIKTKQVNIFKLLPKLPYGTTLLARTLYSSELITSTFHTSLFKQMCSKVEKVVKAQNNKKAISLIGKCTSELEKVERSKWQEEDQKDKDVTMEGESRYQVLKRLYQNAIND